MTKAKKKQSGKSPKTGVSDQKARIWKLNRTDWLYLAGILTLTFIAFIPALSADFVNWDDDYNLGKNNHTALLTWDNIVKIFSSTVIGNYNPLPIFMFAIERHFFGLDPFIYHLNNILLHLVCVFFAYRVFLALDIRALPSAIGALLFGIHPMRVESVAWVTERKDVLFGAFFLAALWFYIRYVRTGYAKKYVYIALGLFLFSLLAKIQAVTLPLTMLLVDYYFRRPLQFKLITGKWMFFLLSLIVGLIGIYFLKDQGSIDDSTNYSFVERLGVGGYALGVYLAKFVFPWSMSPLYPYPASLPLHAWIIAPLSAIGVAGFSWLAFKRDWRPWLFGMLFFFFNVMFVLQVLGAGQGFLADRFTYIPYMGLTFMVIYALQWLMREKPKSGTYALYGMGGVLALFMMLTWNQTKVWTNSETLWTHVLSQTKNTVLPFRNRANYLRDQGRIQEALADYNEAIKLKPDGALYNSRAKLYFNQQQYDLAMADYNRAIEMDNNEGEFYINRGAVFALQGQLQRALEDFNTGIELKPDHANGYKNRSLVFQAFNQWDKADADIAKYLEMHPEDGDLWYERGRIKNIMGQPGEAIPLLDRAIRLNSNQGLFYYEKLKSYPMLGQKANARQLATIVQQYGVRIEPEVQAALDN